LLQAPFAETPNAGGVVEHPDVIAKRPTTPINLIKNFISSLCISFYNYIRVLLKLTKFYNIKKIVEIEIKKMKGYSKSKQDKRALLLFYPAS